MSEPRYVPARAIGAPSERLRTVAAADVRRTIDVELPTDGCAVIEANGSEATLAGIPDGNRSAIVPDVRTIFCGREWMLSVKGVGASTPAYGEFPDALDAARAILGESWMGDAPYGGQGEAGAADATAITALIDGRASIAGVPICPVCAIVEVPAAHVHRDLFWYRRYRGRVLQEHRLVPSDVRLFHGTDGALGRDAERALRELGVTDVEAIDAFAERYLATGVAALTLWARTARECEGGFEGLEYDDVWLDKDSLLGSDGSLFLVDLESLEWTPTTHRSDAAARIRRQIDRNYYELMYGLDAILDVRDRWLEREPAPHTRRESIATRLSLALASDAFVSVVDDGDGIDLRVRAPGELVTVRFLDRR